MAEDIIDKLYNQVLTSLGMTGFAERFEDQLILYIFILVGLGASPILIQFMTGVDLGSIVIPYVMALLIGAFLGLIFFINESGRTLKEFYRAKDPTGLFKKDYRYGLALRIDGNGNVESARLKKHDRTAHYFIDPKTKNPIILDRAKTDFAVQRHSIDGIDVVLVNATDAVPAVTSEARAAAQVLEIIYDANPVEVPAYRDFTPGETVPKMQIDPKTEPRVIEIMFNGNLIQVDAYAVDNEGNLFLKNDTLKFVDFKTAMKPVYPEMYKIPLSDLLHISAMVFEEDRAALYAYAVKYVVMEKKTYYVAVDIVQDTDAEGKPIFAPQTDEEKAAGKEPVPVLVAVEVDDDGNVMQRQLTPAELIALAEKRQPMRKAKPHEVEVLRKDQAGKLADEAVLIRNRLAKENLTGGRCLVNVLYSMVQLPWLQGEMENIRRQALSQVMDPKAEQEYQNKRTDNKGVLMFYAGIAVAVIAIGLHVAGKI